ncbi:AAA family ATPase [Actinoplanes sp. KI2]|uniref:AAA family ATPase n=1 Tax=Actinoplanes sp. KI2 TaxID=2983315 RepID=UPI0021D59572|nr:AAA family ATPase [Actinoplanes sp. KI2]MCU7728377.1 AAA family ATPase [Actinoplanes sp. KI2]
MYRALLLTGVAGVGKSTVAAAAGSVLTTAGCVNAVVDADALAQFGPPPGRARFYDELKCANLAALWENFRAAGARFIVVAGTIDSLSLHKLYADSLAGCEVRLVGLTADDDTVRSRLRQRDTGAKLERHLRALQEHRRTPKTPVEHFTVTNDRTAIAVATEILVRAGWTDQRT